MKRFWHHAIVTYSIASSAACGARYAPPKTYPTPEAVQIQASFDRTWSAVIDRFAATNVPIKTIEKASGIIVAEPLRVAMIPDKRYADCGSGLMAPSQPSAASYNVRVTGNSERSAVRVTATFSAPIFGGTAYQSALACNSVGVFETEFMGAIKAAAEKR